jgi:hypothetical protein
MDWQLADGRTKLQVEGADFRLRLNEETSGAGELVARRGTWMDMVQVKDLQAKLRLAEGKLHLESLGAACGEGRVTGSGEIALRLPQPFAFELKATEVDLEKMSDELPSLRLSGSARGGVQLQGTLAEEASWKGEAKLEIQNGKLRGISLLQMIGQVFQMQEIANFQLKQGLVSARIADKKIWLETLQMDGGDLALSAPGTVDFERNVALSAKLSVPEKLLTGRVAQLLSRGFGAPDDRGLRSIAFQVGGTLEKPSTDLLEKVVGEGLGGVVNQLLGGFLKPRKAESAEPKEASKESPR